MTEPLTAIEIMDRDHPDEMNAARVEVLRSALATKAATIDSLTTEIAKLKSESLHAAMAAEQSAISLTERAQEAERDWEQAERDVTRWARANSVLTERVKEMEAVVEAARELIPHSGSFVIDPDVMMVSQPWFDNLTTALTNLTTQEPSE